MSIWFEGSNEIKCNIEQVKHSLDDLGEHYLGVIRNMPGLSSVELVERKKDSVIIKTNEGIMKRTNITKIFKTDRVVVEVDEEYQAGRLVTSRSHFFNEFISTDTGVKHHMVISNLKAPGFLGFFYRTFGRSNIGNAFLESYKKYYEK